MNSRDLQKFYDWAAKYGWVMQPNGKYHLDDGYAMGWATPENLVKQYENSIEFRRDNPIKVKPRTIASIKRDIKDWEAMNEKTTDLLDSAWIGAKLEDLRAELGRHKTEKELDPS